MWSRPSPQQPNHPHVCNLYTTYDDDPAEDPVPNSLALPDHTWRALHWDVWNSQDPWIPLLPQMPPNRQPRPSLPPVPPHANAAILRPPANEFALPPIHLSPPSHNSSPPPLPHPYLLYPPLLLTAKSSWVLGPPRSHTTSIYPTRASIINVKPQGEQHNGSPKRFNLAP